MGLFRGLGKGRRGDYRLVPNVRGVPDFLRLDSAPQVGAHRASLSATATWTEIAKADDVKIRERRARQLGLDAVALAPALNPMPAAPKAEEPDDD